MTDEQAEAFTQRMTAIADGIALAVDKLDRVAAAAETLAESHAVLIERFATLGERVTAMTACVERIAVAQEMPAASPPSRPIAPGKR